MKKIILAILLIGMMGGCTEPTVQTKQTNYTVPMSGGQASNPLEICVIDGCEYFTCKVRGGVVVSHKGNCKNLIHKGGNK
jgi:hypothetical protein